MIGSLDTAILQQLWWVLASVVGSLFLFLTFVQGGQTLLWQAAKSNLEKDLVINSLGRKWELTFTTLVLFGGALFAAFPKFYSTSFGGAYWVWILILFTFVLQAVSYEFRKKPGNLLGATTYEIFLFINGAIGILLIGAAVGTFFTGSNFTLDAFNRVTWTSPLRGLDAVLTWNVFHLAFNVSMGLFLVFNARALGAMFLVNNIDFAGVPQLEKRLRKSCLQSLICALPFLVIVLAYLLFWDGFSVDQNGIVSMVHQKYFNSLMTTPLLLVLLLAGLVLVILGVFLTSFTASKAGIWCGGLGTVLVGLTVFFLAGFNNTPFYPSKADLQSSLTIYNASSSHFTLTAMTYVAMVIPLVLAYIAHVWYHMGKLSMNDVQDEGSY